MQPVCLDRPNLPSRIQLTNNCWGRQYWIFSIDKFKFTHQILFIIFDEKGFSMRTPLVTVVVPAFNEEEYIRRCLDSLLNSCYPANDLEIIVVDNGSTDKTREITRECGVEVLSKQEGKVGAVRNFGAGAAKGEVLVFVDADCVVDEMWLTRGVECLMDNENYVFGGQYLIRPEASWLERYWILSDDEQSVHQTTLVGGAIFIRNEHFNAVGGFNEKLSAGEDSDLTERLRSSGYTVEINPSLSVVHLGYPRTIKSFIRRQIWHSADYIDQLPYSLGDKVFGLTILFIFGIFNSFLFLFFQNFFIGLLSFLMLIAPFTLSVKRMLRSGRRKYDAKDLLAIYAIDILYLLGRAGGVFRGLLTKIKGLAQVKNH
jgi:glycosyltransferase involved in cell wall biosynthesis